MKKAYLLFVLPLLFAFACDRNVNGPNEQLGEDYEIYNIVLIDDFSKEEAQVLVVDSTSGDALSEAQISNIIQSYPEIQMETLYNFNQRNMNPIAIKTIPNVNFVDYGSPNIVKGGKVLNIWLSQVGYNDSHTRAVVSVGTLSAPLVGAGYLVYLIKISSHWVIQDRFLLWIS